MIKNKSLFFAATTFGVAAAFSFSESAIAKTTEKVNASSITNEYTVQELRALYSQLQSEWPEIQTADKHKAQALAPLTLIGDKPKPEVVALGEKLFFDPLLSKDKTVSCATCHEKRLGFGDKRKTAIGIDAQVGNRNTPNIFGIDHWDTFFWDGRAATAAEQALMPIENPIEMNLSVDEAVARVNASPEYQALSNKAFATKKINKTQMAEAIVAFERLIEPLKTKFADYIAQAQKDAKAATKLLTDSELKGLHLFRTKARCMTCHQGPLLSDNKFHVTGLHYYGRSLQDLGRYQHTKDPQDSGKFRTPSLVSLSKTSPWMHNGNFQSLVGIVNFYNAGGVKARRKKHQLDDPLFPTTTELLPKLGLTKQEKADLVSFLQIL